MGFLGNWGEDFSPGHSNRRGRNSGAFQKGFNSATRTKLFIGAVVLGTCLTVVVTSFTALQAKELPQKPSLQPINQTSRATIEKVQDVVDVVVPVHNIFKGEYLTPSLFKVIKRPRMLTNQNTVKAISDVDGRYATVDLAGDFPFEIAAVSQDRAANELIAQIPDGYRAVTIQTNATTSVEGWARGGAMVDVHWIGDVNGERTSDVLVENARVLSAERSMKTQADPMIPVPSTVTLLTLERDATRIALGATGGQLILQLRGTQDNGKISGSKNVMRMSDILDGNGRHSEVEGYVKLRSKTGTDEEWALINGKLHRKGE